MVRDARDGPDLAAWAEDRAKERRRSRLLAHLPEPEAGERPRAATPAFRAAPPVASRIPKVLGPSAKKFGFSNASLLTHWREVIGPRLATVVQPQKLIRRRSGGAVLVLRVSGAAAMEVQHRKPQLLARINGFLGGEALSDLQIVQGPLPPPPRTAIPARPLTEAERARLEEELAGMAPGPLRRALYRLGEELMRRTGETRIATD
jgi:hypothetical protein